MQHTPLNASRTAQSRFFAYVQDTPWYQEFLRPVVISLRDVPAGSRVLDIGTGPGRLLAMLRQQLALECVGVDADRSMLLEAQGRPELADVPLVHVPVGQALPFQPQTFDVICFCSVLYLMQAEEGLALLQQAKALLCPAGRMIILTPSGADSRHDAPVRRHWTFYLWRRLTSSAGRQWQARQLAPDFAGKRGMTYACSTAFSGLATVEVLDFPPASATF
jgi:ubiquinone/menaquinone biosynthesis C-methylase UbiE